MLACGNKILIVGGEDEDGNSLDTTEWFDGTISNGPTMLNVHEYPSCAFINGRQSYYVYMFYYYLSSWFSGLVYMLGNNYSNECEVFDTTTPNASF